MGLSARQLLRKKGTPYAELGLGDPALSVEGLCVEFRTRSGIVRALENVSFSVAKGETIGHMAVSMSLSVKTVSTYRTRVMEKVGLASNSDLTYYALKNGLIQ